jgi:hypothetical protein
MHPSYVGSRSHFEKTCLKMRCFYLNEFIDVLKSIEVELYIFYVDPFYEYDDFIFH